MSTDFTYNDTTVSTTGGIKPIVKDTPGDARTRVNVYADISSIPYPYVGMTITVKADETNNGKMTDYKVKSLKANNLGEPNTVINEVVKMVDYLGVSDIIVAMNNASNTIVELNNTIALLTARVEALENGGGGGSTTTNVTGITLSTNNITLTEGQTYTLSYTISPSNATNKNVTWSSSNSNVTVSNGVVTANNVGSSVVTVTTADGGYSASCTVTVSEVVAPTTGVIAHVNLRNGNTTDSSGNGNNATLSGEYTTNSDGITFNGVSSTGLINSGLKLFQNGETEYTMKYIAKAQVPTSSTAGFIFVIGTSLDKLLGHMYFLNGSSGRLSLKLAHGGATVFEFGNASSTNIRVTPIFDEFVTYHLTISNGMFKFYMNGTKCAEFTTTTPTYLDENLVFGNNTNLNRGFLGTISEYKLYDRALTEDEILNDQGSSDGGNTGGGGDTTVSVQGVTLSTNTLSIKTGETATLTANIRPSNATNKNVTWSSSNTGIASVNNGVITAISKGTATITVTTVDGKHSASCTVTVSITTSDPIEPETSSYITTEAGYRLLTEDGAYLMSDI